MAKSLEQQIKQRAKKLNQISKHEAPRASAAALNKTSRMIVPRVIRKVSTEKKVPQKILRKRTFVSRATPRKQRAKIYGYAQAVAAVSLLKTTQLLKHARRGTNRRGVRVAGQQYDGAFINVLRKSGRFQVLRRTTDGRYPLEVIKIPIEDSYERALSTISQQKMKTEFRRLLMHELDYRLNKYGRR